MGTTAWVPIAETTLTSSASSIVMSSIPSGYKDLMVLASGVSTSGTQDQGVYFNADTGSNYNCVILYSSPTNTVGAATSSYIIDYYGSVTTDNTASTTLQIFDYAATDKHKSYLARSGRAASGTDLIVGRWASTSAITSITYFLNGGTLATGTTVALWGLNTA